MTCESSGCFHFNMFTGFCSAKNTFALLRVLAGAIGNAYVETAVET